jgi:poly(3-hydroxybutyrate) depolymerase
MGTDMPLPTFEARCTGLVPAGYAGAGRQIYPAFLQLPTLAYSEPGRLFTLAQNAMLAQWAGMFMPAGSGSESRNALTDHCAALMDLPAEFMVDTLRVVFREFLLPRGLWEIAGERLQPEALRTTRLLTVEGDRDRITGAGQTHAAHALCAALPHGQRASLTMAGCDHYDLFSGQPWRERVFPALRAWLAETGPTGGEGGTDASPQA